MIVPPFVVDGRPGSIRGARGVADRSSVIYVIGTKITVTTFTGRERPCDPIESRGGYRSVRIRDWRLLRIGTDQGCSPAPVHITLRRITKKWRMWRNRSFAAWATTTMSR